MGIGDYISLFFNLKTINNLNIYILNIELIIKSKRIQSEKKYHLHRKIQKKERNIFKFSLLIRFCMVLYILCLESNN